MPPPSTASNSAKPLAIRSLLAPETSARRTSAGPAPARRGAGTRVLSGAGASLKVFQASHAGQRPNQREASCPHAEQKKSVRDFAMEGLSGRTGRSPAAWVEVRGGRHDR